MTVYYHEKRTSCTKLKGFLLLFLAFIPHLLVAQDKMNVAKFYLDEKDLTANLQETMVMDPNGEKCALIKVKTTIKGFQFTFGSLLDAQKIDESYPAETWVYVPNGAKHINIQHTELGSLDFDFPALKKARTYVLELTTADVFTITYDNNQRQQLILKIIPKNAKVSINGMDAPVVNGQVNQSMAFGRHKYHISADRYHAFEDTITINDPVNPQVREVNLKQAFGWLKVENFVDLSDSRIYIDDELIGGVNANQIDLLSGSHVVKVIKPLYEEYEKKIVISDSVVTRISPKMIENFGNVSLEAPSSDVEIWIDDENRAMHSFADRLGVGTHKVECKKENYRASVQMIEVKKDQKIKMELKDPTPIYGSLSIESLGTVSAEVWLNGHYMAMTPYRNDKTLIGTYTIELKKKGYRTETAYATIIENDKITKRIQMTAQVSVTFKSKPTGSYLYIDDKEMGKTPETHVVESGKHKVMIAHNGYSGYVGTYNFIKDGESFSKNLTRIYYQKNESYLEVGAQAGTMMAAVGNVGFYASNFNVEGCFKYGLDKSEDIYINYSDQDQYPTAFVLKPLLYYGGKIGYGIKLGGRFRLTPQIGGGSLQIQSDGNLYSDNKTYVASATAGLKIQCAICPKLSLTVSPEYSFAVAQGDMYKKFAKVSSKVKGWGSGFNCAATLNIFY